jgi:hypothetical protein
MCTDKNARGRVGVGVQIDKDGSGEIDRHEFVEYIMKIEAEVKSG